MENCTRIAIIGGTFNPFHTGHLRLAIEASEALGGVRTELVPCATPPHKNATAVLPFALRYAMLDASIAGIPNLHASDLEKQRSGPSYTYDTLLSIRERVASETHEIFFFLGLEDFLKLDTWYRGLDLPEFAHLVVVPRNEATLERFSRAVQSFWPMAEHACAHPPFAERWNIPGRHSAMALFLPRLQISSSFVRSRWKEGRNLAGLVPEPALHLMKTHAREIGDYWNREKTQM